MDRRLKLGALAGLAITAFLVLALLYPIGLQALTAGGLRDVEVLWRGRPAAGPVRVPIGNYTVFCYADALAIRNLGGAGLTYTLSFELQGSSEYFELRSGNETLLLVSGDLKRSGAARLPPGSTLTLTLCARGSRAARAALVVADKSSPEFESATRSEVVFDFVPTDWYDNSFPTRFELSFAVAREGYAAVEITGAGDVYVNGVRVGSLPPLTGLKPSQVLVVERLRGFDYVLALQAEVWVVEEGTGVLKPVRLLGPEEALGQEDRLVFAAFLSNETRVHLYLGGRSSRVYEGLLREGGGYVDTGAARVLLERWGFEVGGAKVNLSGSIAWPYQSVKEYWSDSGNWSRAFLGPVRGIWEYKTLGSSGYVSRAFLTLYSGSNYTLVSIWPGTIRGGIVLEWYLPEWSAGGGYSVSWSCATLCTRLPARLLERGNSTVVELCRNYYLPGGTPATPSYYGYALLRVTGAPLAEVKGIAVTVRSFAG